MLLLLGAGPAESSTSKSCIHVLDAATQTFRSSKLLYIIHDLCRAHLKVCTEWLRSSATLQDTALIDHARDMLFLLTIVIGRGAYLPLRVGLQRDAMVGQ